MSSKRSRKTKLKANASRGASDGPKFVPPINMSGGKRLKSSASEVARRKTLSLPLNSMKDRVRRTSSGGHVRTDFERWHMALVQASSGGGKGAHDYSSPFQWAVMHMSCRDLDRDEQVDILTDRSSARKRDDEKLDFFTLSDLNINSRTRNQALYQTWQDEMMVRVLKRKQDIQKMNQDKEKKDESDSSPRPTTTMRMAHGSPAVPRRQHTPRKPMKSTAGAAPAADYPRFDSYQGASELERSFQNLKIQISPIMLLPPHRREAFFKNWSVYRANAPCIPDRAGLQDVVVRQLNAQVREKPPSALVKRYTRQLQFADNVTMADRLPRRLLQSGSQTSSNTRARSSSTADRTTRYIKPLPLQHQSLRSHESDDFIGQHTARALSRKPVIGEQVTFNPLMMMQTSPHDRKKLYTSLITNGYRISPLLQRQVEIDAKGIGSPRTKQTILPDKLMRALPSARATSASVTHAMARTLNPKSHARSSMKLPRALSVDTVPGKISKKKGSERSPRPPSDVISPRERRAQSGSSLKGLSLPLGTVESEKEKEKEEEESVRLEGASPPPSARRIRTPPSSRRSSRLLGAGAVRAAPPLKSPTRVGRAMAMDEMNGLASSAPGLMTSPVPEERRSARDAAPEQKAEDEQVIIRVADDEGDDVDGGADGERASATAMAQQGGESAESAANVQESASGHAPEEVEDGADSTAGEEKDAGGTARPEKEADYPATPEDGVVPKTSEVDAVMESRDEQQEKPAAEAQQDAAADEAGSKGNGDRKGTRVKPLGQFKRAQSQILESVARDQEAVKKTIHTASPEELEELGSRRRVSELANRFLSSDSVTKEAAPATPPLKSPKGAESTPVAKGFEKFLGRTNSKEPSE